MLRFVLLLAALPSSTPPPKTEMKVTPLAIQADWSLPWEEISGIRFYQEELLVASDSAIDVGRFAWNKADASAKRLDVAGGERRTVKIVTEPSKKKKAKRKKSQWEAVATDAAGRIFLLRENKDDISVHSSKGDHLGTIELSAFEGRTHKDKGFEGLLLLKNGHILVALTKPSVLIEYGPKGDKARGLKGENLLEGEFKVEPKLTLEPLKSWKLGLESGCEFSDLAARGRSSYALLKDCNRIIQLPDLSVTQDSIEASQSFSLPPDISHPEGLEVLGDEGFLVASDVRAIEKNLFWVRSVAPPR